MAILERMQTCGIYLLALGFVLLGDLVILLNAHRFVTAKPEGPLASGSEVKAQSNPLKVVRMAVGLSMFTAIGIFAFLLNRQGCLG